MQGRSQSLAKSKLILPSREARKFGCRAIEFAKLECKLTSFWTRQAKLGKIAKSAAFEVAGHG
jgi:hypothetical protein